MADLMSSAQESDELRQQVPMTVLAVIDAVSVARRKKRFEMVTEILTQWAEQQQDEAVAIERVLRGMETRR